MTLSTLTRTSSRSSGLSYSTPQPKTNTYPTITLEIGSAYLRVGVSNDAHPRLILPSTLPLSPLSPPPSPEKWISHLFPLLPTILVDHLLIPNLKQRRLILILPNVTSPNSFLHAALTTLFETVGVMSVLVTATPITSLYGLGLSCGMVLDVGRRETRCTAVFEGVVVAWNVVPVGFESVVEGVRGAIEAGRMGSGGNVTTTTTVMGSEDVARAVVDAAARRGDAALTATAVVSCVDSGGGKMIDVPVSVIDEVWDEVAFDSRDPNSISYCVLETMKSCPVDLRRKFCQNFVIVGGGLASLTPVADTMTEKLRQAVRGTEGEMRSRFECLRGLVDEMKPREFRFARNLVSWVGGSIMGTMELKGQKWVTREAWLSGNKRKICDWTNIA